MSEGGEGVGDGIGLEDELAARVVLLDIVDHDGNSYRGGEHPADLAELGAEDHDCALHIVIEVHGAPLPLTLKVTYRRDGSERDAFYAEYGRRGELRLPQVYSRGLGVLPVGEHRICWHGRDGTSDKRFLLEGEYEVTIVASGSGPVLEDSTRLLVGPPRLLAIGMDCIQRGERQDTITDLRQLARGIAALPPGRRFTTEAIGAIRADEAVDRWRRCAIAVFDGHGNAFWISFEAVEGERHRRSHGTVLTILPLASWMNEGSYSLSQAPAELFADVLLAIVLACNSGEEISYAQACLRWVRNQLRIRRANGRMDDRTRRALRHFQYVRELPVTGDLDPATIAALGIDPSGSDRDRVRAAQRRLIEHRDAIVEVEVNDQLDAPTVTALRAFQRMAGIPETGYPDAKTRDRLGFGTNDPYGRNIAEQFVRAGCDVAVGFPNQSSFGVAEQWLHALFDRLSHGDQLRTALDAATASVPPDYRQEFEANLYARDGVDPETLKIVPARYGSRR